MRQLGPMRWPAPVREGAPVRHGGRRSRARRRDDSGAALVEFALVFPIFVIMLLGMVQLGLSFAGWSQLRAAVQTGAQMASVEDGGGAEYPCSVPTPSGSSRKAQNTAQMVCEIASLIGTPVGTGVSASSPPEVGLWITGSSNQYMVTVCAATPASNFTGFLPAYTLHATSEVYAEVPSLGDDLEPWNPYGLGGCGPATGS